MSLTDKCLSIPTRTSGDKLAVSFPPFVFLLQLVQAHEGKLAPQIHVDFDWEAPQEFSYDSEDELDEKVMGQSVQH